MSLLDLIPDGNVTSCHIVINKNELDENGKKAISNEFDTIGRFYESSSMEQDTKTQAFLTNAQFYVPGDVDPSQRIIVDGYVEIDGVKHSIVKCQKAYVIDKVDFTRLWLR